LDLFRIVKSTGCRCVGRKAERRIMEARFSDSDFSSGLVVIQSARSVPLPPSLLRVIDPPNAWMNRVYATSGTSWLPWMGHVVALGPEKRQPAGFHVSSEPANGNTSVPLSVRSSRFREREILTHCRPAS